MSPFWLAAAYLAGIASAVGIAVLALLAWIFVEFSGRKRRKGRGR